MKNLQQLRAAREGGFTLIELIIVIVIIGILAAVAIPKFTDLTSDAKKAALNGIGGNIASASSVNSALCGTTPSKCVAVTTCLEGGLLVSPNITATTETKFKVETTKAYSDEPASCILTDGTLESAPFLVQGTSPKPAG